MNEGLCRVIGTNGENGESGAVFVVVQCLVALTSFAEVCFLVRLVFMWRSPAHRKVF